MVLLLGTLMGPSRPLALPWCFVTSKLVLSLVPRRPGGRSAAPVRRGVNQLDFQVGLSTVMMQSHLICQVTTGLSSSWTQPGPSGHIPGPARARGLWLSSCSAFCTVTAP